jgi:hypothetical protein
MSAALNAYRIEKAAMEHELSIQKSICQVKEAELTAFKAREAEFIAKAAEEQEETARAAVAAAAALRASIAPAEVTLPVFCTGDEVGLRKKQIKISDFNNFAAFSYQLKKDIGEAFSTMSEADFKAYLRTIPCSDDGGLIGPVQANQIYTSMKMFSDNLGKLIVVAVAGSKGGGLEIRRVTGGYRYSEELKQADGRAGYFHQYPTEVVRKLTPEESKKVADARKNCYALNWSISLTL